MERRHFEHDGLKLSFLDTGGAAPVLVALHAHWMEGETYAPLARALAPSFRVVAPDQRGHGWSDHPRSYTRADYLGDLAALLDHLGVERVVLLGNSLGGINAFQYAARDASKGARRRVRGMIIEDIGATVRDELSFSLAWEGTYPSRQALADKIGPRLAPYLEASFRETSDGFRLAFSPAELIESQRALKGDHWSDWLASDCPALLIGGKNSPVTSKDELAEMAARRPHTRLCMMDAGHVVHVDRPTEFAAEVAGFLATLPA
jgi:pimeloyl-ACP methyl ester carboxylesterase